MNPLQLALKKLSFFIGLPERWQMVDWFCLLGLASVSLATYLVTLAPGVDPTGSAVCFAKVLNLSAHTLATQPFWLFLCRRVASVPTGNSVMLLNVLSATCGSFAVALLFRVTRRTVFEMIRPPPSIRLVPQDDDPADMPCCVKTCPGSSNSEITDDTAENVIATLGGVIAALAFAFSAPFWASATALNTEPIHVLVFLLLLDRTFCYCFTGNPKALTLALFLLGLGAVESVLFLSVAPLVLLVVLFAAVKYDQLCESFFLLCLLVIAAGIAANLCLFVGQSSGLHPLSWAQLKELLADLYVAHRSEMAAGLPANGWVFIAIQSTFPAAMAVVCLNRTSPTNDMITKWKWGLIALGTAAFATSFLWEHPLTASHLQRGSSHMAVIPSLSVAFAIGAFFAYWANSYAIQDKRSCDDGEPISLGLRLISVSMCALIAIMTLRVINFNINFADGRQTAFADRIANEVLERSCPALCLVSEGVFDINLLLAAQKSTRKVTIASCPGLRSPTITATALQQPDPATPRLSPQPEQIIARWLRDNSPLCAQVAVMGNRYIWQLAGLRALPSGLIYTGVPPSQQRVDLSAAYDQNTACWDRIEQILGARPIRRPALVRYVQHVTALASRAANDLGTQLEQAGDRKRAAACYQRALAFNADNLCAKLNLLSLTLHEPQQSVVSLLSSALSPLVPDAHVGLENEIYLCGELAHQEADRILPLLMQNIRPGQDKERLSWLLRSWLYAFSEVKRRNDTFSSSASLCAGSIRSSQLCYAFSLIAKKNFAQAEKQLQLIVKKDPANLAALAVLSEILLNGGRLAEVKATILPALAQPRTSNDQILALMTQAACAERETHPRLEEARQCYRRVLKQEPRFPPAIAALVMTSKRIGDLERLESDAQLILAGEPSSPVANALLGKIRLEQRRYSDAEYYLQQSVASQPLQEAMVLLALLSRQTGHAEVAEKWARRAICAQPDDPAAWDALTNILLDGSRLAEARNALRCALFWDADNPNVRETSRRVLAGSAQQNSST